MYSYLIVIIFQRIKETSQEWLQKCLDKYNPCLSTHSIAFYIQYNTVHNMRLGKMCTYAYDCNEIRLKYTRKYVVCALLLLLFKNNNRNANTTHHNVDYYHCMEFSSNEQQHKANLILAHIFSWHWWKDNSKILFDSIITSSKQRWWSSWSSAATKNYAHIQYTISAQCEDSKT